MAKVSLKILGPNQTEVHLGEKVLFFSYNTVVAVYTRYGECYRTSHKFSKTTSKHLNNWCPDKAILVPQETIEQLAEV